MLESSRTTRKRLKVIEKWRKERPEGYGVVEPLEPKIEVKKAWATSAQLKLLERMRDNA